MDTIYIKDLLARCVVGINEDERRDRQDVIINIALTADMDKACLTDDFNDAVDYRAIKKRVFDIAESSNFFLIEALAQKIALTCLDFKGVSAVKVLVEKPSALRFARSVGVEIERKKD
jgi:FolB domain-containing protein